jgi:hypothetical protein
MNRKRKKEEGEFPIDLSIQDMENWQNPILVSIISPIIILETYKHHSSTSPPRKQKSTMSMLDFDLKILFSLA